MSNALSILHQIAAEKRKRRDTEESKLNTLAQSIGSRAGDISALEGKNMFDDAAAAIQAGGRPLSEEGRNLVAMYSGMSSNVKESDREKQARVLGYLQDTTKSIYDAKAEAQLEHMASQAIAPMLNQYFQAAPSLSPEGRVGAAQEIVKRYSKVKGEQWEVVGVDGANPYVISIHNPESGEFRTEDFSKEGGLGAGMYQQQQEEKFANDVRAQLEFEKAQQLREQAHKEHYLRSMRGGSLGPKPATPTQQVAMEKLQLQKDAKVEKIERSLGSLQSIEDNLKILEEFTQDPKNKNLHSSISGRLVEGASKGGTGSGLKKILAKSGGMKDEQMAGLERAIKATEALFTHRLAVSGVPARGFNRFLEEKFRAQQPSAFLHPKAAKSLIEDMRKVLQQDKVQLGRELERAGYGQQPPVTPSGDALSGAESGMVQMQDSSTGEIRAIPSHLVESMLQKYPQLKVAQ
jgi:hypothetical protein